MPKTRKKFDWEIFDEEGEFLDILTMSRDESKIYLKNFPNHQIRELGYTDNG